MARKKSGTSAADDARAILNRIRQLVRILRSFEKEAQARFGLGAAQMFIVHVLRQQDRLSLNELAKKTATDQSSVSVAVTRLVDEGYVRREVGRQDRRHVELSLTEKGRALLRGAPPAAQERIMAGVQAMSPDDRAQLMRLLDDVISGVAGEIREAPMLFQDELEPRKRRRAVRPSNR